MKVYCTTCCKEKNKAAFLMPAIQRYKSDRISTINIKSVKDNVHFFILSGKFGLINKNYEIPYYDLQLFDSDVEKMIDLVVSQLKSESITEIVFYMLNLTENPLWNPYYKLIKLATDKARVSLNIIEL